MRLVDIVNTAMFTSVRLQMINELTHLFLFICLNNNIQLYVFEEINIKIYRCVKGDIDRRVGQYHHLHTDKY